MNFRKSLTNSKKEAVLVVAGVGRACCLPPLSPRHVATGGEGEIVLESYR